MARKNNVKKSDGSSLKAAAITIVLFFAAIAIFFISSVIIPSFALLRQGPGFGGFIQREELENYFTLRLLLSMLNIALIIYLLFIYIKDYIRLRASFTLGIVAFLSSFLLYALSSMPMFHIVLGRFDFSGLFSFIPLLFSAIGLIIFAKLGSE